jgi:enoyl-[acyl-carrier-protein] reductase (NADH)
MSSGVENYEGGSELFERASKKVTTAKRVGTVEEISAATLYYLSPAAAYTTGTTMFVDGGWHLNGSLYEIPPHDKCPPYGTIQLASSSTTIPKSKM